MAEFAPLAVLVGNGLSIAYKQDLLTSNLTCKILECIQAQGGGTEAREALLALARTAEAEKNFEALFGPLDEMGDIVRRFSKLSKHLVANQPDARASLEQSADFFTSVRRVGVSHALEQIDHYARSNWEDIQPIAAFVKEVVSAGNPVTLANLNYDALLMSAILELNLDKETCDMKLGYGTASGRITDPKGRFFSGRTMRDLENLMIGGWADFKKMRLRLLHLHGSLAWLRNPHTDQILAFEMDTIRDSGYWEAWRNGTTDWEPVVVLTNQDRKDTAVTQEPFAGAYAVFKQRLIQAQRWLIVGYSFQDGCVNDALADAWNRNAHKPTPIMVVTHGDNPSDDRILEAIQYEARGDAPPESFLFVCRDGVEQASASGEWASWLVAGQGG